MDFRGQVWKRVWKMEYFGLKLGLFYEFSARVRCQGRTTQTQDSKESLGKISYTKGNN